jgi:5-formyltetrahydrofolate cyclo-ligase
MMQTENIRVRKSVSRKSLFWCCSLSASSFSPVTNGSEGQLLRLMEEDSMSVAGASRSASQEVLRHAKRTLRKQMAIQLNTLSNSSIMTQSGDITSLVLHHPAYQKAEKVSIYVSMEKGEVNTDQLCRETLALGKKLYVPRFAKTAQESDQKVGFEVDMKMLRVGDWNDFEAMVMNRWGIREPESIIGKLQREDALDTESGGDGLDLILVPGVAFDRAKGRLGHGKGYYDRYIQRCQAFQQHLGHTGPVTMALALQEQVLAEPQRVPCDERDQQLDHIMSSHGPL